MKGSETDLWELLTARQRDVAALLVKGCSNKEIGRALDITTASVKQHMARICSAVGARNRTAAAVTLATAELSERLGRRDSR
jgi:DNA-binding NarL/FixJ family response regulator